MVAFFNGLVLALLLSVSIIECQLYGPFMGWLGTSKKWKCRPSFYLVCAKGNNELIGPNGTASDDPKVDRNIPLVTLENYTISLSRQYF